MVGKLLLTAVLAVALGQAAFAASDESATVTVRGKLHEDKFGFFVQANGATYDLIFAENNKTDMHKFFTELKDDYVQVSGNLFVEDTDKTKVRMTVYANDIARFQRTPPPVVTEKREVIVEQPPPVIIREGYVERRRHGIDLPGIHIHW